MNLNKIYNPWDFDWLSKIHTTIGLNSTPQILKRVNDQTYFDTKTFIPLRRIGMPLIDLEL